MSTPKSNFQYTVAGPALSRSLKSVKDYFLVGLSLLISNCLEILLLDDTTTG